MLLRWSIVSRVSLLGTLSLVLQIDTHSIMVSLVDKYLRPSQFVTYILRDGIQYTLIFCCIEARKYYSNYKIVCRYYRMLHGYKITTRCCVIANNTRIPEYFVTTRTVTIFLIFINYRRMIIPADIKPLFGSACYHFWHDCDR